MGKCTIDTFLQKYHKHFRNEFESKFYIEEKGFTEVEQQFAMSVISNLIGRIWYFYGSFKVQSIHNKYPVSYGNAPLYTAVPSRNLLFPRVFLYRMKDSREFIWHYGTGTLVWFDERRRLDPAWKHFELRSKGRLPDEFVVQRNNQGNQPV